MNVQGIHANRLFYASCLSLIATAMVFAIRGDLVPDFQRDFVLSPEVVGTAMIGGFWGFTLAMIIGGPLCDTLGMGRILWIAFGGHVIGVLLTIFAWDFWSLALSTWILGIANGFVEAAINPLVATMYPTQKTNKLNLLHAWFPGGIVIGGLVAFLLTNLFGIGSDAIKQAGEIVGSGTGDVAAAQALLAKASLAWKVKMGAILIPTVIYGFLIVGQKFPATERVQAGVSAADMWKTAFNPLFILLWCAMWLTAASELGPNQWIPKILTETAGMPGILVLVYISGIMTVLRFFGGRLAHRFSPIGLLLGCAVLTAIGLYLLSLAASPGVVILAATVFAVGVCFFWPTMLGVTAERFAKGGALLLAVMGGTGMLSSGIAQPVIGRIIDRYTVANYPPAMSRLAEEYPKSLVPVFNDPVTRSKYADAEMLRGLVQQAAGSGVAVPFDQQIFAAAALELAAPDIQGRVDNATRIGAKMSFRWFVILPIVLVGIYTFFFLYFRARGGYRAEQLVRTQET